MFWRENDMKGLYRLTAHVYLLNSKIFIACVADCELVRNIVFESRIVASTYVGVFDWLVSYTVCD